MIDSVNFTNIINLIIESFKINLIITDEIDKNIHILAESNFKCYQANMQILNERRNKDSLEKYKSISDSEFIARTVGEKRVASKAAINKILSNHYSKVSFPSNWVEDDVVYSVGEMIDRILIEHIKQQDFKNNNEEVKLKNSIMWQDRVFKYLNQKLKSIHETKSYESVEEMRTYKLEERYE